ncbi:MAG: flavodoxin-dependent (E)-4-hydroxy-3-methylbut-2-enyl-diphosphate synthase [Deltaproteobacteria bacterium]|jgi:(E)-4-hydroxy-3-methylbut-2-enyl-diphosphate synthase|nr:flavodoxin-dependent (E)-4-hydroxy-3-methylbut-2-enyl-diphosphate synthase [Deltaproteobacteria bacterium]
MVGPVAVGGGAPVVVQTMTNPDTRDVAATLAQIEAVRLRGAELVRVAVPDARAARALFDIAPRSGLPVIADIHFDHRLALLAVEAGAAGLRLNPGNIGDPVKIRKVALAAAKAGAAVRVGVNSGSLDPAMLAKYGRGPEAMVASALREAALIEETGYANLKVSLKASDVGLTAAAARLWSQYSDIPQHLGITESGDSRSGSVRSAVGLGILLNEGLGDTVRVSLTGPPEDEVDCAWEILRSLELRSRGPNFISCPTCGRCEIDLPSLLADVKSRLADLAVPLTVAVMGCVVNGPGEAGAADLGVAGGRGGGRLFVRGSRPRALPYGELAAALESAARKMAGEREAAGAAAKGREGRGRPEGAARLKTPPG